MGTISFILSKEDAAAAWDCAENPDAICVLHPLNARGEATGLTLIGGHANSHGQVSPRLFRFIQSTYRGEIPSNVKVFCCHSGTARRHYGGHSDLNVARNLAKALIGDWDAATQGRWIPRDQYTTTFVLRPYAQ